MLILGLQKTTLLDYPGKIASTIFTGGCNFKCPYCHNRDLVMPPADVMAYSYEEIFNHLQVKKKVLDGVCITGGEPTLHKDLPDFIKQVKDMGLLVKLDSNGTNPDMISSLINDGLIDYVAMDIKHSKAKYNSIASMTNFDLAPIEASVALLKEGKIDYEFRTTVVKGFVTYQDLVSILDYLGCSNYYLQKFEDRESNIVYHLDSYTDKELKDIYNELKENYSYIKIRGVK